MPNHSGAYVGGWRGIFLVSLEHHRYKIGYLVITRSDVCSNRTRVDARSRTVVITLIIALKNRAFHVSDD